MTRTLRNLILPLVALLVAGTAAAQQTSLNTYTRIQVKGLTGGDVYLANYYGNKLYYADTAQVSPAGQIEFKGRPFNEQGKYAVVIPGKPYFDIIIGNEDIEIVTDTTDLVRNLEVTKSWNNKAFYDYVRFINDMRGLRAPHDSVLADSTAVEKDLKKARKALVDLNDQVVERQKSIIASNPDKLFAKYIRMMLDVEVPEDLGKDLDEEERNTARYEWYKAHYWDNVDLNDNRMVRDQAFHSALERYVSKVLPQIPDSMGVEASRLIDRVEGKEDLFKYIVHHFTYYTETSKLMCMDKAFVYMVDNYYAQGKCGWMDPEKLATIIEAANDKRQVLCDAPFPDIRLMSPEGEWMSVRETDTKYTVVVVWESTCGHCKKEMPKLAEFYAKHKDIASVYAIGNDYEREPWVKFMEEKELPDWIDVSDDPSISNDNPEAVRQALQCCTNLESLNFRRTLDINSTPKIWLLDEDHVIIAKQLNAEQLEDLVETFEGIGEDVGDGEIPDETAPEAPKQNERKRTKGATNG